METTTNGEERTSDPRFGQRVRSSVRLFSTKPGAPRNRRPTDWILLVIGTTLLFMACWSVEPPGRLSNDVLQLVDDSPEWVLSIWLVFFEVMLIWAALLVLLTIVRRHFVSAAAAVASVVVALLLAYLAQRLVIDEPLDIGDFLREFTVSEGPPSFPAVRLLTASAVLSTLSPAVSRPFRFFGRIVLLLGFLGTVGLGTSTVAGAAGGLAAGVTAAAVVHLVAGSPGGRPSRDEILQVLAELGVPVHDLQPASLEPAGVALMDATHADGRALTVKFYGRDAWDGQFLSKFWRSLWYKDSRSTLLLSRLHQVEHEALMTLLAARAGTPVAQVLVAGQASRDAAVVTTAGGTPLAQLASTDRDDTDRAIMSFWEAIGRVHRAGIVHEALDLHTVTVDSDGRPLVADWSAASVAAPPEAIDAERAQMLVLSTVLVGNERALAIARDSIDRDDLARLIPYLQNPALNNGLRRDVDDRDVDVEALRDATVESLDVEQVEEIELRRVTFKSVASTVLVALAAFLLISSLSDIGLDTIVEELSTATWGWVLIALLTAQFARLWSGLGTTGATNHPLRLGPTMVLEFAITFVNLVVPSSAARFATKMRYFQKAGMTLTSATAMGAIDSLAGFTVQITILLSALLFGLGGIEIDVDVDQDAVQRLATIVGVLVVVAIVVGILVVALVPKVREQVRSSVHQLRDALKVVKSPTRLLRLFGGNAMAELTFAAVLGFSLLAYGESASIVSLLVINVAVALLAGLMPIPGGIGVSEAALTAGLVAIGIPEATAFAAAITTRLCTFYLPPIWGYVAMRWLRENDYV